MDFENNKVGVWMMEKAVNKLNQYGLDTFELYADEVDMSYCDRNRVIAKCRIAYGRQDILEMPLPKELKGERWNFYTKTLGFSNHKANEILGKIDKSLENQFIPQTTDFSDSVLKGV